MNIAERESSYFFPTYKRLPIEIDRAEGLYLIAKDSSRYLDMFGGIAVNALGYNHPKVVAAIQAQLKRYIHVSNFLYQDAQVELAELLLKVSGFSNLFLTNSGTEAIEGALKLARKWGKTRGKQNIFGLSDSFHGRSLGALSITGREKYRSGYEPFLPETSLLKFNDLLDLEKNIDAKTLAVVLEFIQGEGGINLVSPQYAELLRQLQSKYGFLVIADEIQSGLGRTGKFFAYQHFDFEPDIVVVAKALGGGLPLGAFMGRKHLADVFTVGTHGSTFGGNPIACAAGLATLKEIAGGGLMQNAASMGSYLMSKLGRLKSSSPSSVAEVRGKGLMVGLELAFDGTVVIEQLLKRKVLLNLTNQRVLRWLPPLIVREEHIDTAVEALTITLIERNDSSRRVSAGQFTE